MLLPALSQCNICQHEPARQRRASRFADAHWLPCHLPAGRHLSAGRVGSRGPARLAPHPQYRGGSAAAAAGGAIAALQKAYAIVQAAEAAPAAEIDPASAEFEPRLESRLAAPAAKWVHDWYEAVLSLLRAVWCQRLNALIDDPQPPSVNQNHRGPLMAGLLGGSSSFLRNRQLQPAQPVGSSSGRPVGFVLPSAVLLLISQQLQGRSSSSSSRNGANGIDRWRQKDF